MRKGFAATEIAFEGALSLGFDTYGSYLMVSDGTVIGLYAGKQWAVQHAKVEAIATECKFTDKCEIVGVNKNRVVKYLIKQ